MCRSLVDIALNVENWEMFWGKVVDSSLTRKGAEGMLFACGGLNGSWCDGRDGLNDSRDVFKTKVSRTFSHNEFQLTLFSASDFNLYIQTPLCSSAYFGV